jgi:hypothetical protein
MKAMSASGSNIGVKDGGKSNMAAAARPWAALGGALALSNM